jgi:hypothetical protein
MRDALDGRRAYRRSEMNTWTIGDTTFIGNSDLSGDIEIQRPLSDDHVMMIKVPGRYLAIFMRNRLVDAINQQFGLADS